MSTPNRRALLRLIVGDAAPAAIAASAKPSATPDGQDELCNIGLRLLDLENERGRIRTDYFAARDRMNEVAPLPPKPRPRKIEEGKPKRIFPKPLIKIVRTSSDNPGEDTPANAYSCLNATSHPEMMREQFYHVSWRYHCRLSSAARESGYADAVERLEKVEQQIKQTAAEVFEIKARTSFDVTIQAYALLEAFAVRDGRAGDEFAKKLACNVIGILPGGGGGSQVTIRSRVAA